VKKVLIFLIKCYRYLLSPLWGYHCRFYPSCSQYGMDALQVYGALQGSWLTLKRICRCHPWHAGGYDPIPSKKE